MQSYFDDVDPSGQTEEFVANAYKKFSENTSVFGPCNFLYIWGNGDNGKSTLISGLQNSFPGQTKKIPYNFSRTRINDEFLIFMNKFGDLTPQDVNRINSLTDNHRRIGFIMESNYPPPENLRCLEVKFEKNFHGVEDRSYVERLNLIRASILESVN